jgi:hypothetical protein
MNFLLVFDLTAAGVQNSGKAAYLKHFIFLELKTRFKGTGSPDGLGFSWQIWIDLGLKKGSRMVFKIFRGPFIIH